MCLNIIDFIMGSSVGLSISSILMATLVAQAQTMTMYILLKAPPEKRSDTPIATPPSTRDWLNIAQILTQWICSLILFAMVIFLPSSTTTPVPSVLSTKVLAVMLWILHTLLFVFVIEMSGGQPNDPWNLFNMMRGFNAQIINPFFTFIAVTAFFVQVRAMPVAGDPNVCSKLTLGLQCSTFFLLAISWPFRLIPPYFERGYKVPAKRGPWYRWVGWASVNNAIIAIGQGIMLLLLANRWTSDGLWSG